MSTRDAVVIGLGQFGMALAQALERNGVEVFAVDRKESRTQLAAEFATEAVALDATDEEELGRLAPAQRDLCVCAIGDESRESSIIVTALLKQMGAKRIVARATDALHERILHLVGAHEVVNPERNYGERLAARLAFQGVVDFLPVGENLVVSEIRLPQLLRGRTLSDLALPRRFGITVLAIHRGEERRLVIAEADTVLQEGDLLLITSTPAAARQFMERS